MTTTRQCLTADDFQALFDAVREKRTEPAYLRKVINEELSKHNDPAWSGSNLLTRQELMTYLRVSTFPEFAKPR